MAQRDARHAGLWSADVLHSIRMRSETFRAACPSDAAALDAWWAGSPEGLAGVTSTLVVLDPAPGVREAFRFAQPAAGTRPRYRGYAEAAAAVQTKRPREPDH